MVIIGVTGGIGSGKSTVSQALALRGAEVISADAIVHELLATDLSTQKEILAVFPAVGRDDGSIDRAKLAESVFAGDESRRSLEAIVHHRVRFVITQLLESIRNKQVVVLEIPLLVESNWTGFDLVVVVEANEDNAKARAYQNGISNEQFDLRRSVQSTDSDRAKVADVIINNDKDRAHLDRQIDQLWNTIEGLPQHLPEAGWPGPASE